MGLAAGVGDIGHGRNGVEGIAAGGTLGQHHGHIDGEVAVAVGSGITLEQGGSAASTAAPPPSILACDDVLHLGVLYRHAAVHHGASLHHHGIAGLVGLMYLGEGHLIGGTLVLLHAEALARSVHLDGE